MWVTWHLPPRWFSACSSMALIHTHRVAISTCPLAEMPQLGEALPPRCQVPAAPLPSQETRPHPSRPGTHPPFSSVNPTLGTSCERSLRGLGPLCLAYVPVSSRFVLTTAHVRIPSVRLHGTPSWECFTSCLSGTGDRTQGCSAPQLPPQPFKNAGLKLSLTDQSSWDSRRGHCIHSGDPFSLPFVSGPGLLPAWLW